MTDYDWLGLGDATNTVRILGFLLPLVTALVTKYLATSRVKASVTFVLSLLTSSVAYLVADDAAGYDWAGFVNAFFNTFAAAIAAYYGLWKPTGVTGSLGQATRGIGIGGRSSTADTQVGGTHFPDGPTTRP